MLPVERSRKYIWTPLTRRRGDDDDDEVTLPVLPSSPTAVLIGVGRLFWDPTARVVVVPAVITGVSSPFVRLISTFRRRLGVPLRPLTDFNPGMCADGGAFDDDDEKPTILPVCRRPLSSTMDGDSVSGCCSCCCWIVCSFDDTATISISSVLMVLYRSSSI